MGVLQDTFDKCNINKHVEVQKLIKAKPLDNIEFLQWLKKFYETHILNNNYDPVARRNGIIPQIIGCSNNKNQNKKIVNTAKNNGVNKKHSDNKENIPINIIKPENSNELVNNIKRANKNPALTEKVEDLQIKVNNLEKERDFYFSKLRDIETYLQAQPVEDENITTKIISKLLYATVEEKASVDSKGNFLLNGKIIDPLTINICHDVIIDETDNNNI